ncbi:hypothetical protein LTR09_009988 [Extremus antarcticus]|uniref:Wings apart-like protein C-terminal domain-containing protein n=1 Tax=Extremus antarcticus TaxID=702011 RepID=A0AAJ0DEN3_9PEZI|nr:hypothetical protein LTR09_009988 [Extremus antarcticus]
MATTSTLQAPRRKKLVYGKLSKPGYNAATFFDDEDELAASAPTIERKAPSKPYAAKTTEAKGHISKPARAPTTARDPFDIPSSDDEFETRVKLVPPPKYTPNLVDDTRGSELAPWETRKKPAAPRQQHDNTTPKNRTKDADPNAQLRRGLARATQSPEAKPSSGSPRQSVSPAQHSPNGAVSPANGLSPANDAGELHATSAAARLAARRRLAASNAPSKPDEKPHQSDPIQKRINRIADSSEGTPRKRARMEVNRKQSEGDVDMADVLSAPSPRSTSNDNTMGAGNETDIYDFPEISGDEEPPSRPAMSPPKVPKRNAKRGKLATTRLTPRKGVSAPARLAEMIATDTDTTDAPTSSPSVSTSRRSTPNGPSTPQSVRNVSPGTPGRPVAKVTPKQANFWSSLLPSDPVAPSPSTLPIKDLSISGSRRATATIRKLTKSQSVVEKRRTRLVDRLKATAVESDGDTSDEDNADGPSNLDTEMVEEASLPGPSKEVHAATLPRQASYTQSQSQSAANVAGPKITYSSVRTYLPEDNMEADLMLGLNVEPPQPVANSKRAILNQSQKSAFDFDESEDEGPGKMRSIHELRASGSNVRDMGDVEDLLDDIAKHKITQRGTRRNALVTLATKLMDKSFKSRFVGQSCEARLAADCGVCPDAIADFLLMSCVALLLDSEPPQHVLRSFQDSSIAGWLTKHLANDTTVSKLAKDRKHNMSKSAQVSLQDITEKLRLHTALWHENVPSTLSPRLVGLRALDLLVRALRRAGDKSDVVDRGQMQAILLGSYRVSDRAQQLDLAMSVSVLESLSTRAVTLNWPADVIEKITHVLPQLDTGSTRLRDASFLALRLCLNLTNDNARNCELLSKGNDGSTTSYLLRSIEKGFGDLGNEEDAEKKTVVLDLLLLAIGVMINLTDHSNQARTQATSNPELLDSLVNIFQFGQRHMLEAESEEESIANVTFGYLAVMLANLCQSEVGRAFIASKLPGQNLRMLVDAVEEFVAHHQKVDTMNFEGEEGREVWSGFTEKLKVVLGRLKEAESA